MKTDGERKAVEIMGWKDGFSAVVVAGWCGTRPLFSQCTADSSNNGGGGSNLWDPTFPRAPDGRGNSGYQVGGVVYKGFTEFFV